jgi:hypothetical protein
MTVTVALAGDTMLGRGVTHTLTISPPQALIAPEVRDALAQADLVVLNPGMLHLRTRAALGRSWQAILLPRPTPGGRAAGPARDRLRHPGQQPCPGLRRRRPGRHPGPPGHRRYRRRRGRHRPGAGPPSGGAGRRGAAGCGPGVTDHPADFAAGPDRPGVAFADLARQCPSGSSNRSARPRPTPCWSPPTGAHLTSAPARHVRRAATALVEAGATLIAGHSAHVPHGVAGPVLYDLGDYRVDPRLRNDLGLLFLVTLDPRGPVRLEALPLKLEYCHTRLATGEDATWMQHRFRAACAALGTAVEDTANRLTITGVNPAQDHRRIARALRAEVCDALCLVELRGFEPLTPCMPSAALHKALRHLARHHIGPARPSCRTRRGSATRGGTRDRC